MSQAQHFLPYTLHTEAEKPTPEEEHLGKTDKAQLERCRPVFLSRRRWEQYLQAGRKLTGKLVRIKREGYWDTVRVAQVERHSGTATICFMIVSTTKEHCAIMPDTEIWVENDRV